MARPICAKEWDALKRIAIDTAGRGRAGLVLRAIEGRVFVDDFEQRSSLHFDERTCRIDRMVLGRHRCWYSLIHEFGHAYHCFYWPVLSALMSPVPHPTAEAVAILFELELHEVAKARYATNPPKGFPTFEKMSTATWNPRRKFLLDYNDQQPKAFDILHQALHNPPKDFHEVVRRIVDG